MLFGGHSFGDLGSPRLSSALGPVGTGRKTRTSKPSKGRVFQTDGCPDSGGEGREGKRVKRGGTAPVVCEEDLTGRCGAYIFIYRSIKSLNRDLPNARARLLCVYIYIYLGMYNKNMWFIQQDFKANEK